MDGLYGTDDTNCGGLDNNGSWVNFEFTTPTIVNRYEIGNYVGNEPPINFGTSPKDFKFEGSMTGEFNGEQVLLDSQTNINYWNGSAVEPIAFDFNNNVAYKHYRITFLENNGHSSTSLTELTFYHSSPSNDTPYPEPAEEGQMVYDIVEHKLKCYNGSEWKNLF